MGMTATSNINYVVVGRRPDKNTERSYYNKHLFEVELLELESVSVDQVMRRIVGPTPGINGPCTIKGDDEEEDANDMDDDEEGSRPAPPKATEM